MRQRAVPGVAGADKRILLQNGEHWLRNNGDLAMLEVTVGRIKARWPEATVSVLTSAPSLLMAYLPDVRPVSDSRFPRLAGPAWSLAARLGPPVVGPLSATWLHLRKRAIEKLRLLRNRGGAGTPTPGPAPAERASPAMDPDLVREVQNASLVLAIGGGYVTDVDPEQSRRTFDLLECAIKHGVPTAMVGQGLGPLADPGLWAHAARVLPHVDLIALREGRRGPELLSDLGVAADRVVVTGDDAIELAHGVGQDGGGADLGICLRVADYSPVSQRAVAAVRDVLHQVARDRSASLVPLIISEYRAEDRRSTLPLVAGAERVVPPLGRFVRAGDVAARVSRCRVVVTGAYHLAVFALSQGIPVVALTSSTYYDDKFLGLAAMFEGGVDLVHLEDPDLGVRLDEAIRSAWDRATTVRGPLREHARRQIAASNEVLDRALGLVERTSFDPASPLEG